MAILSKKDTVIIIYRILDEDDFFQVDINKDYIDYIGGFDGEFEFQAELDFLEIKKEYDDYIYYGDLNENQLKEELEKRGFKVEFR